MGLNQFEAADNDGSDGQFSNDWSKFARTVSLPSMLNLRLIDVLLGGCLLFSLTGRSLGVTNDCHC